MDLTSFIRSLIIKFGLFVAITSAIIIAAPFRFIFEFLTLEHPDLFRKKNTPENHARKVQQVQAQVREWNKNGRKTRLCTARPGWQTLSIRKLDKSKYTQIKMDLEDIIEINIEKRTIRVEPGLKMGTLTHRLLPLGWTIPIVPELETLTVGGLINGAGLESSSHKYGLFADTCLEYELVLSDGSLVTCSPTENENLFDSVHMSYGTLGLMTAATIKLIPAQKYVRLEYHKANTIKEAENLLRRKDHEFVEGITFDKNRSVIMFGDFSSTPDPAKINVVNKWYKHWFFKNVETYLDRPNGSVEFIPLRDYYHRHQRPFFWMTAIIPFANNRWYSLLFGWAYPANAQMIKLVLPTGVADTGLSHLFIQDFVVPLGALEKCIEFSDKETKIYPIWLCPSVCFSKEGLVNPKRQGGSEQLFIDIGIYGEMPSMKGFNSAASLKRFEKFIVQNQGYQGLYADCSMSREDFEKMFDLSLYEKVRKKLNCEDAFPHVYDKIHVAARI